MLDLVRTNEPEATILPSRICLKVRDLLNAAGISFKEISMYDIDHYKDEWPGWIRYRGELLTDHNYALIATVTKESLFKAAEDMYHMEVEEIQECGKAQRERKE
jgi:hypothetical protein